MSGTSEKPNYKKTLNLPKTAFAMKANLVQREPAFQKRWDKLDLYAKRQQASAGRQRYVLHDGPPYANGSIHLGHLLNKVLKDIVVRSRAMLGHDAPYIPGWDCHGLPIEHKVVRDLGAKADGMNALQIRKRCHDYAAKYVKLQSKQFRQLGVMGDFDEPYVTMAPAFEAATLEVFARLVERDLVYRALRPVHWSIANRTALADAELEYIDREDDSIFVLFEIEDPKKLPASLDAVAGEPIHLMIWTTTPWTLPANMAVAVGASAEYGLFRFEKDGRSALAIVATSLKEQVFDRLGAAATLVGRCTGGQLDEAGITYRHPFLDRIGVLTTADYVTLEDGTGLVHTAPGHGADDFRTGQTLGLDLYCPVQGDGSYDESVPEWIRGMSVWDANPVVVERLRGSGHLYHHERFEHSYPHDWRSKTPTIFRATEQWFVRVDDEKLSLRKLGLDGTSKSVGFYPEWGRNRMTGMLQSRPDWCVSRQRMWGLPIPAFFTAGGEVLLTPATVRAVAAVVEREGSDAWFKKEPAELLADYDAASDPDAPAGIDVSALTRGQDIFDVWFESGSSWFAVAERRGLGVPVDLYLEGSDQHRGWFQLSLLTALGVTGKPPFREILTHGFIVDRDGKKMSKSLGNTLEVEALMKRFGADICRWWVCSLNAENDVKVDEEIFQVAGEEYRKVRNTIRFLLSNLGDFDASEHRRELTVDDAYSIDAWVLAELARVVETVRDRYQAYDFRRVHEAIFNFCNDTLSAVYLSAVKDRLYCDRPESDRRRRAQTVLHTIADALIHMIAPVLVHTADEAFLALAGEKPDAPQSDDSVHLKTIPEVARPTAASDWPEVMELRDRVLKALEQARKERELANPLDTGVRVSLGDAERFEPFLYELADLCGVSRFSLLPSTGEERIEIDDLGDEPRCERSWKRDGTVSERSDGGLLTDRDAAAVGLA